jgi:hypothetical protein
VWNDNRKQVEPFHKIGRHVRGLDRRLRCAQDSPVQEGKHLMVILYDLLLLNDRATSIARGGGGLVLKGCADPYFRLDDSTRQVKPKKDYITDS